MMKIGQRVNIKHSRTSVHSGVVIERKISYVVKQDDGLAFWYDEPNLTKTIEQGAVRGAGGR